MIVSFHLDFGSLDTHNTPSDPPPCPCSLVAGSRWVVSRGRRQCWKEDIRRRGRRGRGQGKRSGRPPGVLTPRPRGTAKEREDGNGRRKRLDGVNWMNWMGNRSRWRVHCSWGSPPRRPGGPADLSRVRKGPENSSPSPFLPSARQRRAEGRKGRKCLHDQG